MSKNMVQKVLMLSAFLINLLTFKNINFGKSHSKINNPKTFSELASFYKIQRGFENDRHCGFQYQNQRLNRKGYFYLKYPKGEFKEIERKGYSTWNFDNESTKFESYIEKSFFLFTKTFTIKYFLTNCDALLYSALLGDSGYQLKDILIPNEHYNDLLAENGYINPRLPDKIMHWDFREKKNEILELIDDILIPVGYIPKVGDITNIVKDVTYLISRALDIWNGDWIHNANGIRLTDRFLRAIQYRLTGLYHPQRHYTKQGTPFMYSWNFKNLTKNFSEGLVLKHIIQTNPWTKKIKAEAVEIESNHAEHYKLIDNNVSLNQITNLSEERYFNFKWDEISEECKRRTNKICDKLTTYREVEKTYDRWKYRFTLWDI